MSRHPFQEPSALQLDQKPQAVHELRKSYKQSLLAFIGWDRTFGAE